MKGHHSAEAHSIEWIVDRVTGPRRNRFQAPPEYFLPMWLDGSARILISFRSKRLMSSVNYADWSRDTLISRINELETQISPLSKPTHHLHARRKLTKQFDFNSYPRRKIALKFCYVGAEYNGLAIQSEPTPLPTVEAVLLDALGQTRLIDSAAGMEGCGWARCGRTDRGVSAAGQVISLWVRSAVRTPERGVVLSKPVAPEDELAHTPDTESATDLPLIEDSESEPSLHVSSPQDVPELQYVRVLNRVLPPSIRILAWSPVSETFDARFSCQYRHYKYFFTLGPTPHLDLAAMRDAANRLGGEHDFRNFCKLDPSKQISNFKRRITRATIDPQPIYPVGELAKPSQNSADGGLFVFNLVGTAFLWHQVRHIMSILFLVGSKLEKPSIVDTLLNVDAAAPRAGLFGEDAPPLLPTKPSYQMADFLPLVLWDCGFREEEVKWQTDAVLDGPSPSDEESKTSNVFYDLHAKWSHDLIQTAVSAAFLNAASELYPPPSPESLQQSSSTRFHLGGGMWRRVAKYIPLFQRPRGEVAEVSNEKWRAAGGLAKREVKAARKKAGKQTEATS